MGPHQPTVTYYGRTAKINCGKKHFIDFYFKWDGFSSLSSSHLFLYQALPHYLLIWFVNWMSPDIATSTISIEFNQDDTDFNPSPFPDSIHLVCCCVAFISWISKLFCHNQMDWCSKKKKKKCERVNLSCTVLVAVDVAANTEYAIYYNYAPEFEIVGGAVDCKSLFISNNREWGRCKMDNNNPSDRFQNASIFCIVHL